jgi:hypothetical protein
VLKSKAIAQCLVNSRTVRSIEQAEKTVRVMFAQKFPDQEFDEWNRNIDEAIASHIINTVGRKSRIDAERSIDDLW